MPVTGVCGSASTRAEADKPPGTLTVAVSCLVIVTSPERLNTAGPLTSSAVPPPLAWASTPVPPEAVRPCTAVPPPCDSPFTPGPDPRLIPVTAGLPLIPEVEVVPVTPTPPPTASPNTPESAGLFAGYGEADHGKPTSLTRAEFDRVQLHPLLTEQMLRRSPGLEQLNQVATKAIAQQLVISPKTADTHIQHICTKIGASTRGAAALFAMQHDLLP